MLRTANFGSGKESRYFEGWQCSKVVDSMDFGSHVDLSMTLPLPNYMTLGKSLNFSSLHYFNL